jgi:hypothetical protein
MPKKTRLPASSSRPTLRIGPARSTSIALGAAFASRYPKVLLHKSHDLRTRGKGSLRLRGRPWLEKPGALAAGPPNRVGSLRPCPLRQRIDFGTGAGSEADRPAMAGCAT